MTNPQNFEPRLDQAEEIASILVNHVEAIDSRLEQVTAKLDRLAQNQEQSDRRIEGLTSNIDSLAVLMAQQISENELDRQQAAQDRAQVRSLIEALTQRFSSNGHS